MEKVSSIKRKAVIDNLMDFINFVSDKAESFGFHKDKISDIQLAIEELITNIFNYAYTNDTGEVEVTCKKKNGKLIIEIVDSGVPFNILERPNPKFPDNLDDADIGGLGVYLVKELIPFIKYYRKQNKNVLTLGLPLSI